ncbi:MAG: HAMP domain-containing protein [Chitinivibrionales bacterium]|nr:HAMP domain-containing protein [Chitinivibrionales bacterium]
MKISISTKLFFGFLFIIVLNAVFFSLVYMRLNSLKSIAVILSIQKNIQNSLSFILKYHTNQEKARVIYSTFNSDSSLYLFDRYKENIAYQIDSINRNLARLDNIITTHQSFLKTSDIAYNPSFLGFQGIIRDSLNQTKINYNTIFEEYTTLKKYHTPANARIINQIMDSLNIIFKDNSIHAQSLLENETLYWIQKIDLLIEQVIRLTQLLLLILAVSSIGFALFFSRFISNNLRRLKESVGFIAKGNFDLTPRGYPNDEIGELANAFFEMADDLKKTQSELDKKRRLAAIGEIVAAVNHEINNPLQIISGNAQFLEMTIDMGVTQDVLRDRIRIIIDEVDRISQVTKKLRDIKNPVVEDYTSTGEQMINLDKSSK